LNGLAEATFSHRNILITFEYSWLSRTAPNKIYLLIIVQEDDLLCASLTVLHS